MPEQPTIARGDVWVDAKGQRRYVTCVLRNPDGTETIEYREGDFKPAKKMTAQKFSAQYQKETAHD